MSRFKNKFEANKLAVKVYQCKKCAAQHYAADKPKKHWQYIVKTKPSHCLQCGHDDFFKSDSIKENRRLNDLILLLRAGAISDLKTQVTFRLKTPSGGVFTRYRADFVYYENERRIIEDHKGSKSHLSERFKIIQNYFECEGYQIKLTD